MGKSTGLVAVAMLSAIVMGLFADSPYAEAKGNCEAKLFDTSYGCTFQDNSVSPFSDCLEFGNFGVSQYFDLAFGSTLFGCACDPKGSSFDSSSSAFECSDVEGPYLASGTIKGKKLSIQGIGADGEQFIGKCTENSSPCPP